MTLTGFSSTVNATSAGPAQPMDVSLRYVADGDELLAEFAATARGPFTYCRIGFNVLFPMELYGSRPATSWRSGAPTPFTFPAEILTRAQHDPVSTRFHRPFDRLEASLASGTSVHVEFEGNGFEFEDQRNWTDPSYKAYSCAPPQGWPVSAVEGERFFQRLRIRVTSSGAWRGDSTRGSRSRPRRASPPPRPERRSALLRYFDAALPADSPAVQAVFRLRSLRGREVLAVDAPSPLAVLAVRLDDAVLLAVANPAPDPVDFELPDGRSESLPGFASAWYLSPARTQSRYPAYDAT